MRRRSGPFVAVPARYPAAEERRYTRLLDALAVEWGRVALEQWRAEVSALQAALAAIRQDDDGPAPFGWAAILERILTGIGIRMVDALQRATGQLESLSRAVDRVSAEEWRRQVRAAWGVDPVNRTPGLRDALSVWEQQNLDLIKSLPEQAVRRLRGKVVEAVRSGQSVRQMEAVIREETSATRKRARLIAADQTGKLMGNLQEIRQRGAGIEEYIWRTSRDERVRPTHRAREGKKYRWDDTGLKPGQDFRCRCDSAPIFPPLEQLLPGRRAA